MISMETTRSRKNLYLVMANRGKKSKLARRKFCAGAKQFITAAELFTFIAYILALAADC